MPVITFGPYFSRGAAAREFEGFESVGVLFEFAAAAESTRAPVYFRKDRQFRNGLGDFFIHYLDLPCEVKCPAIFLARAGRDLLVPLEESLLALYRKFPRIRELRQIATEFRQLLPERIEAPQPTKEFPATLIRPEYAEEGIRLSSTFYHGKTISVGLKWIPKPDASHSAVELRLGQAMFRVRANRTLGRGRWFGPRRDLLLVVLREELARVAPGAPLELLSEEGKQFLLDQFPWDPLTLMTPQQARCARIEFLRENRHLWEDPNGLAKALVEANLYSKHTGVSYIRKALPKLLFEAGAGESRNPTTM